MTDEHTGVPDPPEHQPTPPAPPAAPPTPAQSAMGSMSGAAEKMFSTGEGMVAFAGMVLIAVWLIFEVITDDYSLTTTAVVLAVLVAIAPRMPEATESMVRVPVLMKASGILLGIVGAIDVIADIETGLFDAGGITIVAALISYAAYAMAFLGARSINT